MKYLVPPEKPSQSILVGCLLAASGGLQDAYTYNVRDQVFANAQTGNMVLVGQSLALGQWAVAVEHLIPVLAFAGGVFAAEVVHNRFHSRNLAFHWRQAVVLLEAVILCLVAFLPLQLLLANGSGELCVRHARWRASGRLRAMPTPPPCALATSAAAWSICTAGTSPGRRPICTGRRCIAW